MDLFDQIDDILEQEDFILPKREIIEEDYSFDEDIFSRMADFIINLDPDKLSDSQLDSAMSIIDELGEDEEDYEEEIQELKTPKLARRTSSTKNQYSKKWYRINRAKIKKRKAKFRRSAEGRKRQKARMRLARQGKTATGRKKVRYHVRKRSDRADRERNLSGNEAQ